MHTGTAAGGSDPVQGHHRAQRGGRAVPVGAAHVVLRAEVVLVVSRAARLLGAERHKHDGQPGRSVGCEPGHLQQHGDPTGVVLRPGCLRHGVEVSPDDDVRPAAGPSRAASRPRWTSARPRPGRPRTPRRALRIAPGSPGSRGPRTGARPCGRPSGTPGRLPPGGRRGPAPAHRPWPRSPRTRAAAPRSSRSGHLTAYRSTTGILPRRATSRPGRSTSPIAVVWRACRPRCSHQVPATSATTSMPPVSPDRRSTRSTLPRQRSRRSRRA